MRKVNKKVYCWECLAEMQFTKVKRPEAKNDKLALMYCDKCWPKVRWLFQ
jgi:hypothetical protein